MRTYQKHGFKSYQQMIISNRKDKQNYNNWLKIFAR